MNKIIGYFLPRPNISRLRINDITQELALYLIEAKIMLQAIQSIKKQEIILFDSTIGDRKCQTRASMLIDCINKLQNLNKEEQLIENMQSKIDILLNTINNYKVEECIQLIKILKNQSIEEYISHYKINYTASENLKLLSLCLISTYDKENLMALINFNLTPSKTTKLLNFGAKATLCKLSIDYERELAQEYNLQDIAKCLNQIEKKGFCSMTAFFPSFKPIFEKMKHKQQPFAKKTTHFCLCGGVIKNCFEIFNFENGKWIERPEIISYKEKPIMVIYGFQYLGSFNQLKTTLNIPLEEISIPKQYHRKCTCNNIFKEPIIENIEQAILSCFASHPQFTTDAQIDWKGLGIEDSDLHREYEFLKTLNCLNTTDMGKFCINHIYAATIKEAIECDSPSIHINITEQQKDLKTNNDADCPR